MSSKNDSKINFGADFSGSTTTGPVQSLLLAFLSGEPRTLTEIRAAREGFGKALRSLIDRGLVEQRENAAGVVRFALATRAARQIGSVLREAPLSRRFGVVVSGVPERSQRTQRRR
jgi:hypothetical protein